MNNGSKTTKSRNMKNPTKAEWLQWISEAWSMITEDHVKKAFYLGCWKLIAEKDSQQDWENDSTILDEEEPQEIDVE